MCINSLGLLGATLVNHAKVLNGSPSGLKE